MTQSLRSHAPRRLSKGCSLHPILQTQATVLSERLPWPVIAHESIKDGEEFSHGGDERHLGTLSGVAQAAIEGLEGRVMTDRDQGRHVEGAANTGATSGNVALAAQRAAVVIERGDADKSSQLLMADRAELGQLRQQHGRGEWSDALDGGQDGLARAQLGRSLDGERDGGIDLSKLGLELHQVLVDPTAHGSIGMLEPVLLSHQHVDDLTAPGNQAGKGLLPGLDRRQRGWPHGDAEPGDDPGIQGVGLCQLAGGTGKIADLPWIDECDRQRGDLQGDDERRLVPSDRFENDQSRWIGLQIFDQFSGGVSAVGDAPRWSGCRVGEIQMRLRDVDTDDASLLVHDRQLLLAVRAQSPCNRSSLCHATVERAEERARSPRVTRSHRRSLRGFACDLHKANRRAL